jgi:UDP-N-acetylglucosamine 2-epimerase (non-hydrolysing)
VTIEMGTNTLLGMAPERIAEVPALIAAARERPARIPDGWDGRAAERVIDVLTGAQLVR